MVAKKAGATKKKSTTETETAVDPLVLANGKTTANEAAVDDGLACYGLDPTGDLVTKLARLRSHLTDELLPTIPVDDRVQCAVCDEIATDDTSACPFCGDLGSDEDEPAAEPEKPAEPEPAKSAKSKGKGKPAAEPEPEPAKPAAEPEPEKPTKSKGKGKAKGEPAAEPEKPAEGSVSPAGDTAPAAPLATVAEGMAARIADLDAAVARIRTLAVHAVENYYDLGVEIARVHKDETWKARGHASFKAWIEAEVPISRATCYRLIDVVGQFDRDTYSTIGLHKLALIASGEDDEARADALEAARTGATARDVQRIASGDEGEPEKPERSKPEREKGEREKPKREGKISLVAKVDGEAKTYGWRSAKSGKAIKSHAADAYVEIPIADGVVQRIALKLDDEKIVGVTVAFVRVAEPDAE